MSSTNSVFNSFQGNATYQITIEGKVEPFLLEMLPSSFKITNAKSGGKDISSLIGKVEDQAQLAGILNTIYNTRMTVISVLKI
ncbi:MAG: hypothetical protein ABF293_11805 [Flavobacteriaceae bacterium]